MSKNLHPQDLLPTPSADDVLNALGSDVEPQEAELKIKDNIIDPGTGHDGTKTVALRREGPDPTHPSP